MPSDLASNVKSLDRAYRDLVAIAGEKKMLAMVTDKSDRGPRRIGSA